MHMTTDKNIIANYHLVLRTTCRKAMHKVLLKL
jgi:hypothetical protein